MRDFLSIKRVVQKTGASTLTVSLPKGWADKNGVLKGSELYLVEEPDGSLVLSSKAKEEKRESFDLSASELSSKEALKRKFYAAYLAGFDSIRVHSSTRISPEFRKTVIQESKRLIGLEIVEETPTLIIAKDFFSREGLSMEKTLKRMHLITCSLFEDFLEGKELEAVSERDDEVDRLRFLLLRQLNLALKNPIALRSLGLSANRCVDYATVTLHMEHIADKITGMADLLSKNKKLDFKPLKPDMAKAYSMYSDALKAFLTRDFDLAIKVLGSRQAISSELVELDKRLWQRNLGYAILLQRMNGIIENSAGVAEQAINQS